MDVVGEVVEPGRVDDRVDVPFSAGGDGGLVDWVGGDVVRFAPVIPREDLDEFRLQVDDFVPALVPEIVAAPEPVLAVL